MKSMSYGAAASVNEPRAAEHGSFARNTRQGLGLAKVSASVLACLKLFSD